jgi:hypothetical protein
VYPGHARDSEHHRGLIAAGRVHDAILREYPYLEAEDIAEAVLRRLASRGSRSSTERTVKFVVDMNLALSWVARLTRRFDNRRLKKFLALFDPRTLMTFGNLHR